MNNPPLVTIGMPTYNGEQFIREALDSLLAQDFEDFELIISDNASTDKTSGICKEYAKRDPRVKYYRNEKNIGSNANFNRLVDLAQGKFFMWAADDDLWEPSFVSSMLGALKKNPEAVLSFCRFDIVDVDGKLICNTDYEEMAEVLQRDLYHRMLPMCYVKLYGLSMATYIYGLIRKDVLLKCGGFEKSVDVFKGSDIVTLFRMLSYGPFLNVNRVLFHRRDNIPRMAARDIDTRKAKRSLRSRMNYLLEWQHGLNGHYAALRGIVRKSSLGTANKLVLIAVLYGSELRHYIRSLFVHSLRLFGK